MLQPQIPAEFQFLMTALDRGDLHIDLYGEFDSDGYNVTSVALAGSKVDISELFSSKDFDRLSWKCEAFLPSWNRVQRDRAAATREPRLPAFLQRQVAL